MTKEINKKDEVEMEEKLHNLLFGVRKSVRYYNRRCKHYDTLNLFVNAITVLFGFAAFVTILSNLDTTYTLVIAALVTFLSAMNLLIGTSIKARLHSDLSRRFIELEKKMVSCGKEMSDSDLNEFTAERLDIESDEPPPLIVLNSICHNELLRAMGYNKEEYLKIGLFQRIFAHYFDLREHSIEKEMLA